MLGLGLSIDVYVSPWIDSSQEPAHAHKLQRSQVNFVAREWSYTRAEWLDRRRLQSIEEY